MNYTPSESEAACALPAASCSAKCIAKQSLLKGRRCCAEPLQSPYRLQAAESSDQLRQAFHLVHSRYVQLGYMIPVQDGLRCSAFELLPTTRTFVALQDHTVLCTASVVLDTPIGLPSEHSFAEEIAALRDRGRVPAEGTMFAADAGVEDSAAGRMLSLELMEVVYRWSESLQIDDLLLVVNPKHLAFWERFVGFERLSGVKQCRHVKCNDGYLLRLDMQAIRAGVRPKPAFNLGGTARAAAEELGRHFTLCEDDVLELLEDNPSLLAEMSNDQMWLLSEYYPAAMARIWAMESRQPWEFELASALAA